MTYYHAMLMALAAWGGGVFCGVMYVKHGLGWIPAFEAEIKADIAKIIATLEYGVADPSPAAVQPPPVAAASDRAGAPISTPPSLR